MAPAHETVIRAIGSALAGLSAAFAVYMLAYGAGKTRINGMEHLATLAHPRGPGGAVRGPSTSSPLTAYLLSIWPPQVRSPPPVIKPRRTRGRSEDVVAAQADRVWLRGRWRNPHGRARR